MFTLTEGKIEQIIKEEQSAVFYFYTPICGTCQVAGKMMDIINQMIDAIPIGKMDLNYSFDTAKRFEIESVPCVLILKDGKVQEKIYAVQSVPYLLEKIHTITK